MCYLSQFGNESWDQMKKNVEKKPASPHDFLQKSKRWNVRMEKLFMLRGKPTVNVTETTIIESKEEILRHDINVL